LIQTQDVLDLLADGEHLNRRDTSVFGCVDEDKPVGMMALRQIETEQPDDPREPPIIEVLVTIPDSKGAGKSLVERAVNISASWGTGGRLRLEPKNDEAKKAFQAMGFVDSDGYMELDPASSSKWWRKDEKWQIRRHENDRK
jgi:GNAT superfamily N-acetyltransferase